MKTTRRDPVETPGVEAGHPSRLSRRGSAGCVSFVLPLHSAMTTATYSHHKRWPDLPGPDIIHHPSDKAQSSRVQAAQVSAAPSSPTAREAELVQVAVNTITLLNARDFTNAFFDRHISPNIRTEMAGSVSHGFAGYLNNFLAEANKSPSIFVDIDNATALVDETLGTGTVILSQFLKAFRRDDHQMASSMLMKFSLIEDVWVCQSSILIFGTPEFLI